MNKEIKTGLKNLISHFFFARQRLKFVMKTFFHLGIGAASKTFSCLWQKTTKIRRVDYLLYLVNVGSELITYQCT